MAYTLVQMIQAVCGELFIAQPTAVISSTDQQVIQLLSLANRVGKDLTRKFEWQRAVKAYVFTTTPATTLTGNITSGSAVVGGISSTAALSASNVVTGTGIAPYAEILTVDSGTQVTLNTPVTTSTNSVSLTFAKQDYDLPSDYDRMISDTNWDRTNHWRNMGTKSSQEWQWLQGGIISVGPRERYRIYNNRMRIFAALTVPYTFAYEYVSTSWVIATGGTAGTKAAFTADTDTCIYPDDLMVLGIKYRWYEAKGLEFGGAKAEFEQCRSICKAEDVPLPSVSLSPTCMPDLIGPWSTPDGNWPTTPI